MTGASMSSCSIDPTAIVRLNARTYPELQHSQSRLHDPNGASHLQSM